MQNFKCYQETSNLKEGCDMGKEFMKLGLTITIIAIIVCVFCQFLVFSIFGASPSSLYAAVAILLAIMVIFRVIYNKMADKIERKMLSEILKNNM
jgi:membrane protein YdbS with pleckstrin-like domain